MAKLEVLDGSKGFAEFADLVGMPDAEAEQRQRALQQSYMPFKVTDYYAQLIASTPEPYRSQLINIVLPPVLPKPFVGRLDPYGNRTYRESDEPFLQHKYDRTLLLHIDDFCIANCQFCYKVNEIRNERTSPLPFGTKVEQARAYLDEHPEIDNVLFTGGDPAAFRKTADLIQLIDRLISHPNIRIVRFATKGLSYDPERFLDEELLNFLRRVNAQPGKQVSVIAQINHPAEISPLASRALNELMQAGVQVRGQPALVRGVNDSEDTLVDLQRRFVDNRVVAYYLVIFMPVKGVEQYGMPLDYAFRQVAASKKRLSGLEKKGVLIAPHDFGKLEVCGFYPSSEEPRQIVLKWHEVAKQQYLPPELVARVPTQPEDILLLDYAPDMYCMDHVFERNGLPFIDSLGALVQPGVKVTV